MSFVVECSLWLGGNRGFCHHKGHRGHRELKIQFSSLFSVVKLFRTSVRELAPKRIEQHSLLAAIYGGAHCLANAVAVLVDCQSGDDIG